MRSPMILIVLVLAVFLTGGMCDSPEEVEDEEIDEPAAERLQEPREIQRGQINDNLDELRDDLEETATDRQQQQDDALRGVTDP